MDPLAAEDGSPPNVARRLLLALVPLAIVFIAIRVSGIADLIDVDRVRMMLRDVGPWALPSFVFAYGIGIVAHIPGSIFVGAAVLAYGPVVGGLASYLGAAWGNLLSFGLVRMTGYRPLRRIDWPILTSLMRRMDEHPTWSVTVLRVVFPTTAPVNYALALSGVRLGPFIVGSLIGVLPQLIATIAVFGAVF